MKKKHKLSYRNFPKINSTYYQKFDGGGEIYGQLPYNQVGQMAQTYGQQASTNLDGSVNSEGYAWSNAVGMAGQGAAIGTMIAPGIGTGIGAGVGLVGGYLMGDKQAEKINKQVASNKMEQEKYKHEIENQKNNQKALQQEMYTRAYNANNSMYGNVGTTLYAKGGTMNGNPSSKKVIDRNAYKNDFIRFDTTGAGNNDISGDMVDSNFLNLGFKKASDVSDIAPVWISPEGQYVIKHPSGKGYVGAGNVNQLRLQGTQNTSNVNTPVTTMNRITTPTRVLDNTVTLDPNRKPLDFSNPNQVFDPNTNTYLSSAGTSGQVIKPIVEQYGDPTKRALGGFINAQGGTLKPLADDTVKAVGNTHEEGGIDLINKGTPYAEIEDQEIVKGNKVYSDRIKLENGKTIAEEAEKLGKKKGKLEEKMESDNYRTRNGAKRMYSFVEKDLNKLFNFQETITGRNQGITKFGGGGDLASDPNFAKYSAEDQKALMGIDDSNMNSTGTSGQGVNWNSILNAGAKLVPFADNAYNSMLIRQTPELSTPGVREAFNATAMPLKTDYNIDPALSDANKYYRNFNRNVDENTSSSQVARANKLAAFSELLNNRTALYGNKENIETGLRNQNAMNIQGVNNQNAQNQQNVYNQNIALKDDYNYRNFQRQNDINQQKSANMSNLVNDAQMQIQDRNMRQTQQGQIFYDTLKNSDAAGLSNQIGTPEFDNMVKGNPQYKKALYDKLVTSGQRGAISKFEQMYGKP